jgi:cob(I)alamin adenosyltransferase
MSVLTVLGSGMTAAKALNSLISEYRNAPAAILALSNQVSDLIILIQEVRDKSLGCDTTMKLSVVLDRADAKLQELNHFIKKAGVLDTGRLSISKTTRRRYEKLSWAASNNRKAQELKQDLQDVKLSIILLLSTATMYELIVIQS